MYVIGLDTVWWCLMVMAAASTPSPQTPVRRVCGTPRAVCIDSSGRWLFVGHGEGWGDNSVVSVWRVEDTTQHHTIHRLPDVVLSLSLHQDHYLAVGTDSALCLLDVDSVLHD